MDYDFFKKWLGIEAEKLRIINHKAADDLQEIVRKLPQILHDFPTTGLCIECWNVSEPIHSFCSTSEEYRRFGLRTVWRCTECGNIELR